MDIHSDPVLEPGSSGHLRFSIDDENNNDMAHVPVPASHELPLFTKTSNLTEKFILDLLTMPDAITPIEIKGEPTTDQQVPVTPQISQPLSMTWDPCLDDALSEAHTMDLTLHSKQSPVESSSSCQDHGGALHTSNAITWSRNNPISDETLSKDGGSQLRSRRRREFHKIHTRRSRAKLNEKMDLLKKILPKPPSGVVVKSKAQIIEYTISVLRQLSLPHVRTESAH